MATNFFLKQLMKKPNCSTIQNFLKLQKSYSTGIYLRIFYMFICSKYFFLSLGREESPAQETNRHLLDSRLKHKNRLKSNWKKKSSLQMPELIWSQSETRKWLSEG